MRSIGRRKYLGRLKRRACSIVIIVSFISLSKVLYNCNICSRVDSRMYHHHGERSPSPSQKPQLVATTREQNVSKSTPLCTAFPLGIFLLHPLLIQPVGLLLAECALVLRGGGSRRTDGAASAGSEVTTAAGVSRSQGSVTRGASLTLVGLLFVVKVGGRDGHF